MICNFQSGKRFSFKALFRFRLRGLTRCHNWLFLQFVFTCSPGKTKELNYENMINVIRLIIYTTMGLLKFVIDFNFYDLQLVSFCNDINFAIDLFIK